MKLLILNFATDGTLTKVSRRGKSFHRQSWATPKETRRRTVCEVITQIFKACSTKGAFNENKAIAVISCFGSGRRALFPNFFEYCASGAK
jgi:hypothetical protein